MPVPKVPGDGGLPEGFNASDIHIFEGYFCKFMCKNNWDNFYEVQVYTNDEFKTHARAIYNNESERDSMEKIFDADADYQRMTRYVITSLVNQDLLTKELESDGSSYSYWKTSKLKELCPNILAVGLPSIDFLVDEYDKEHGKK